MIPAEFLALVTGASRGIGRGIAVELARSGYGVVINYAANQAAAEECRELCEQARPAGSKARFKVIQADVSNAHDRERLVRFVSEQAGWLDLLVNNAAVAPEVRTDLLHASEESFDRLIAINLKGPYFLTQAMAKFWIAKMDELPAGRPRPKVVNISSVSAYAVSTNRGDYCVSKAGLSMATRLYAVRLAEYGINVYEVRPGVVKTDMTASVQEKYEGMIQDGITPIARWGTPQDVGRAVAAIATGALPFSTGEVINVDGGFHLHRL
jgi:3-oxoacyl-[acyl-carrier protein] reductase